MTKKTSFTAKNDYERGQFTKHFEDFAQQNPNLGAMEAIVIHPQGKQLVVEAFAKRKRGISRIRVAGPCSGRTVSFEPSTEWYGRWLSLETNDNGSGGDFGIHETLDNGLENAVAFLSRLGGGEILIYWSLAK